METLYDEKKVIPNYTPTNDESKKVTHVKKRFSAMHQARSWLDKDWDIYQTMIDAVIKPYGDDRSTSAFPLASAMIELYVAEATKITTEFLFKSETTKHSTEAKALEYVWKYDRRKKNRKKEIIENEYTTAAFWHSILFTGFESKVCTQKDIDLDDNYDVVEVKREFRENKILLENLDPRNFFLDNQATKGIDNANDCIMIQRMSYEEFQGLEYNKIYKNIEYVRPCGYDNSHKPFSTNEEIQRQGDYVKLTHYRNLQKDNYVVIANGIVIRDHAILSTIDGRKALPFVVRVFGKKNGTYMGRGICETILMFNSQLNNLWEMLMDGINRSNNPTIAIWNWLTFDGRSFAFNNEILTFDGKFNENFQQITGTPPWQALLQAFEMCFEHIAITTGIDIKSMLSTPQQTAYQTNVQQESSQKRINVYLTNRDLAFERLANLHKDNLQRFFPKKDANGIFPEIEIEDEELKDVQQETGVVTKFVPKKWSRSVFEVTPELLRGDIYIDVFTNTNRPTSNIADRQAKLEFLQWIPVMAQGLQTLEQMWVPVNAKKVFKDQMESYNLTDVIKSADQELQAQAGDFIKKMSAMMPSNAGIEQMWQLEQNTQQLQAIPTT